MVRLRAGLLLYVAMLAGLAAASSMGSAMGSAGEPGFADGAVAAPAPSSLLCPGDCDLDEAVTVNESVRGVNIALGRADVAECLAFDSNEDGVITVDELIQGVTAALSGCVMAVANLATGNCVQCHQGIEEAHPRHPLGCTQCHTGNRLAHTKQEAHVEPQAALPRDATTLPIDYFDLDYLQFLNPSNLRVARRTCGAGTACHGLYVDQVVKSMMATTAGHLTGGGYLSGILPDQTAQWGNFEISDDDGDVPVEWGALPSLAQIPPSDAFDSLPLTSYQRHYADVPRKICARCHLWSRGSAQRGAAGQEANHRSEGCAACHMPYTDVALSESADPTIDKTEPGHPRLHAITRRIPSEQCAHCHYRGARIGLSYRGLAQLPPDTPVGPGYPGLTPGKIHGAYHLQDPTVNPPDVHHERGMHCIDCHVRSELMGDGNIYGHMDQATEIECEDCHGTPWEYGRMRTARGTPLTNLAWENGQMVLTSKVTRAAHVVRQVKDSVDPASASYNAIAAAAMDARHLKEEGGLECYTCHAAWQPNCYGCHFNRDLGKTALDMIAGTHTPGKPATDDKYFVNFKNFHMGINAEGKVAPYITGCQVLATVVGESGETILEQELPVTAAGLSGLALNPSHTHTNQRRARQCVECHRNPAALGLGTESFNLSRTHLFALAAAPEGALAIIDRKRPAEAAVVATLALPEPKALRVVTDPIDGRARVAYVGDAVRGLLSIDLADPRQPRIASELPVADPRGIAVAGQSLFVAAGAEGVLSFDASDPLQPRPLGAVRTAEARALAVHGLHLLVADGPAGLAVVDVKNPSRPAVLAVLDLNGDDPAPNDARGVFPLPDYSDPRATSAKRFYMMAYVADGRSGVRVVNLDDPADPYVAVTVASTDAHAVFAKSHYDPGTETNPSREREYLYIADGTGGLRIADVSDPWVPSPTVVFTESGPVYDLIVANAFEPPRNKAYLYAALAGGGTAILDVSETTSPAAIRTLPIQATAGLDIERVQLDRMVDEDGRQIKDTSHEGARPFRRGEIERILGASF